MHTRTIPTGAVGEAAHGARLKGRWLPLTRHASPSPARSSRTSRASSSPSKGISREVVDELSKIKGEPDWMREKRLKSLEIFERKPIPTWGVDLSGLNLDELVLYSPPDGRALQQLGRRPRRR